MKSFDLQEYITHGAEAVVADAVRAAGRNPKEAAYLAKFALSAAKASALRRKEEREGLHVPTFLIASITSACNLHCAGCYSRSNHATEDGEPVRQLSAADWGRVFGEAAGLGISFILLAGGEPLLRRSVIREAAARPEILFPVFTNGTYIDEEYLALFDASRNLLPVVSLEGGEEETDARRGEGVHRQLMENLTAFADRGLVFGASVTVTKENLGAVTGEAFAASLAELGCRALFWIEYVPVTEGSESLAPDEGERDILVAAAERLRETHPEMLFLRFPGDEKVSDGCLAAGRGFFHINSHGGAEPCPFSPYSDTNVKDKPLRDVLASPLFAGIREGGLLREEHAGGCTLFVRREEVEVLTAGK